MAASGRKAISVSQDPKLSTWGQGVVNRHGRTWGLKGKRISGWGGKPAAGGRGGCRRPRNASGAHAHKHTWKEFSESCNLKSAVFSHKERRDSTVKE
eukprot:951698-Pelagomonas_calceolata.AAC.7